MNVKQSEAERFIAARVPFRAGSLRGEPYYVLSQDPTVGLLPAEQARELVDAHRANRAGYLDGGGRESVPDAPAYVVYSYATPIAWVTHSGRHVFASLPALTRTTARHIAIVRRAWGLS